MIIKRPEVLNKIFSVTKELVEKEKEVYKLFLVAAEDAQREYYKIGHMCSIKFSHKFSIAREHSAENSSFRLIFFFYAKLRLRGQQMSGKASFVGMDAANENWTFQQLTAFLRDFHAIPNLVSKDDVQFLWKVQSLQYVRLGKKALQYLSFDETKDFLSRVAILAYNRPGMRRLILNANGIMPSQKDLIETFCRFLHFDDFAWVQNKILTAGKERIRNQTMLAVGEANQAIKSELRDDVKGKRMANIQRRGSTLPASITANTLASGSKNNSVLNEEDDADSAMADKIAKAMQKKTNGLIDIPSSEIKGVERNSNKPSKSPSTVKFSPQSSSSVIQALGSFGGVSISETQENALLQYDEINARVFEQVYLLDFLKIMNIFIFLRILLN